jgi:phage terminase small subunit
MTNSLTPKQALFVKKLSRGHNQTESAILAGYSKNSASSQASRMLRNANILKTLDSVGLTDKRIAEGIKKNALAGEGVKATADTSIRAFELALRLRGYFDKENEPANLSQTNIYIKQLKQMSDQDLQERLNTLVAETIELRK